jgi:hypothetical protein
VIARFVMSSAKADSRMSENMGPMGLMGPMGPMGGGCLPRMRDRINCRKRKEWKMKTDVLGGCPKCRSGEARKVESEKSEKS